MSPQTSGRSLQEEKLVKTLKSLSWVITDAPGSSACKIWLVSFFLILQHSYILMKFIFVSWPHTQAGKTFLQFILISLTFNYPEKLSVICELEDFTGHFIFPITYKNLKWSLSDNKPWSRASKSKCWEWVTDGLRCKYFGNSLFHRQEQTGRKLSSSIGCI